MLTFSPSTPVVRPWNPNMEHRTARLTILIDPRKKKIFEEICAAQDLTASQVVRRLIRQYIIDNAHGRDLPDWLKPVATNGDEV